MADLLLLIATAAGIGIVSTEYLLAPGGLLDMFHVEQWPGKLSKLFTCSVCLSSQVGFWLYLCSFFAHYSFTDHLAATFLPGLLAAVVVERLLYPEQ